ncbi:hypothetical protein M3P05_05895 [Sansalvadorimonas sp. 2012CJ34-2]|uniref:Uncharacterized protein n=1 Tax=Parendozoicomonas callyspongiae TaxID=2942213 RepID=A0ABT0PEL3_9GAMM|nr:hypothetical protein [Sansalvadorimonas sp. 2012CJ34-2]MCL6269471.1 hypothetical protein [Sansalvadorimonas sp. 2012CJ34-2]
MEQTPGKQVSHPNTVVSFPVPPGKATGTFPCTKNLKPVGHTIYQDKDKPDMKYATTLFRSFFLAALPLLLFSADTAAGAQPAANTGYALLELLARELITSPHVITQQLVDRELYPSSYTCDEPENHEQRLYAENLQRQFNYPSNQDFTTADISEISCIAAQLYRPSSHWFFTKIQNRKTGSGNPEHDFVEYAAQALYASMIHNDPYQFIPLLIQILKTYKLTNTSIIIWTDGHVLLRLKPTPSTNDQLPSPEICSITNRQRPQTDEQLIYIHNDQWASSNLNVFIERQMPKNNGNYPTHPALDCQIIPLEKRGKFFQTFSESAPFLQFLIDTPSSPEGIYPELAMRIYRSLAQFNLNTIAPNRAPYLFATHTELARSEIYKNIDRMINWEELCVFCDSLLNQDRPKNHKQQMPSSKNENAESISIEEGNDLVDMPDFLLTAPYPLKNTPNWFSKAVGLAIHTPDLLEPLISSMSGAGKFSTDNRFQLYKIIFNKVKEHNGIQRLEDYRSFMDWLARMDPEQEHPALLDRLKQDVLAATTPCDRASLLETHNLQDQDIPLSSFDCLSQRPADWFSRTHPKPIRTYLDHTSRLKIHTLRPFLRFAPSEFSRSVLRDWLTLDQYRDIREELYGQTFHPLQTSFFQILPWNTPIQVIAEIAPLPTPVTELIPGTEEQEQEQEQEKNTTLPEHYLPLFHGQNKPKVLGRTLIADHPTWEGRYYLKLRKLSETRSSLTQQATTLRALNNLGQIESKIPEVLGVFAIPNLPDFLHKSGFPEDEINRYFDQLLKHNGAIEHLMVEQGWTRGKIENQWLKILFGIRYGTHSIAELDETIRQVILNAFKSTDALLTRIPPPLEYERYVYDGETEESIVEGLRLFARDYGRLWKNNVMGPDALSAYHDASAARRAYLFAPTLRAHHSVGTVDRWADTSTNYPNIGPAPVGMRDAGDTMLLREKRLPTEHPYIKYGRPHTLTELNDVRIEALAKTAWGTILLFGRSFKEILDHNNPERVTWTKMIITELLADLFTESFSLPRSQWLRIMNEFDLVGQVAREMNYWMAFPSSYVEDTRNGYIPASVYPNWRANRHIPPYDHPNYLTDEGFMQGGDSPHLGGRNGRNSLLSLDALLMRMITTGMVTTDR